MVDVANVGQEIVAGVKDVFSTMLMVDLENEEVSEDQQCTIESNLTSMLGLGGGIRGMLAIHCTAAVAKGITGDFLGIEVESLDEAVKDAIGEIANMVAGNLKVSLATQGIDVELAIPTSIVGNSFAISGMGDANRVVVVFKMGDDTFWVELLYMMAS